MSEFVIEYELEKVKSNLTKEYLKEVISSYNSGNYRSTIVVLYSVVIFDLLEKMKILSEIYNDEKATKILDELKVRESNNDSYSSREKFLMEEVKTSTVLLNDIEYGKLLQLRENRNWCAHPVHNQDYKLINPSREEARAFIRISFESVFQKEALLSKELLSDILRTSADYYDKMHIDGLERYLNDKFYSKMNDGVKNKIFTSLWKIVFVTNNDQCNKTRHSSYYALLYLINTDPNKFYDIVKKDNLRYSNIEIPNAEIKFEYYYANIANSPTEALIYMLSEHPKFYTNMTDAAKAIINSLVTKNITYTTISYYMSESIESHLEKLIALRDSLYVEKNGYCNTHMYDIFSYDDIMSLYNVALERDCEKVVKEFMINLFVKSPSYATTDSLWKFIFSNIRIFTEDELEMLLDGMNKNSQIYDSRNKSSIMNDFNRYYSIHRTSGNLVLTNYSNLV